MAENCKKEDDKMLNRKALKAKIRSNRYNSKAIAQMLGISLHTFYARSKNDTFTTRDVRAMANALHLTATETLAIFFGGEIK